MFNIIMDAIDYVYDMGLLSGGFSRYFEVRFNNLSIMGLHE